MARRTEHRKKGAAYYWNVNKESAHLLPEIRQAFTDGNQKKSRRTYLQKLQRTGRL